MWTSLQRPATPARARWIARPERAAGTVPRSGPGPAAFQRTQGNRAAGGILQAQYAAGASTLSTETSGQIDRAAGRGRPLPGATRSFMESRLGAELGDVRVHADDASHRLASSLQARAFTVGQDVFFHRGQYRPESAEGRRLLAHELVHTVQQRGERGRGALRRLQRAQFNVGSVTVQVDFSGLHSVTDAMLVSAVESRFVAYTGAVDASAIHAPLTALTPAQQRWVLYGLDLLQDNTTAPLHDRLNRTTAVQRLIAHAPSAIHSMPGGALGPSQEEALRVAGWLEVALAAGFSAPKAADRRAIRGTLNPRPSGGVGAPLDTARFHARMDPAVRHLLTRIDPASWGSTGTRSLPRLKVLGDELMTEARSFFSPYAHTARTSVFGLNPPFHVSANIFSVRSLVPDAAMRRGYLRNRATIVGRNTAVSPLFSDRNVFRDVNFDGTRRDDRLQLEALIRALLTDAAVTGQVDRLIQHTGRQSGSGAATTIGLSTEFNAGSQTRCEARWSIIETLCHEIMHALAHPDFEARSSTVGFGQVLLEGFPEVLATQMFNGRVKPKAAADPAFKARMEAGITPPACPAPPAATIGYGAAGAGAESIRTRASVGNDRFRSAFFLGQVQLIGL